MQTAKNVNGILNLSKPSGISSRKAVNQVASYFKKVKVGHAGTLDPLASGVLVVCVGASTRLIESVQDMTKTYRVVIRLDATSDTLDADGEVIGYPDPIIPSLGDIERALERQTGLIEQMPPAFSALKVNGVRAYTLARKGEAVALAPRTVRIDHITVLRYEWPRVELEVECGGGTYIRSIARDLGETIGCGGLVEVLVRSRIGPFTIESAIAAEELTADTILGQLRPSVEAVPHLGKIVLTPDQLLDVSLGKAIRVTPLAIPEGSHSNVALLDSNGLLVAIGELSSTHDSVQPRKVMMPGGSG